MGSGRGRDAAFMERLRGLAREALAWPFLQDGQRLVWAAVLEFDAELPPWFFERHNFTRRHLGLLCVALMSQTFLACSRAAAPPLLTEGVDLFSLDGQQAPRCTLWTDRGCKVSADLQRWLREYGSQRKILTKKRLHQLCCDDVTSVLTSGQATGDHLPDPRLRPCQEACLEACAEGARVIEMACGTGKTRVIRELAAKVPGKVLVTVPSRVLLEQFAEEMPGFCKVGMGYNDKIDFSCRGFISVTDSVQLLKGLKFEACFVDEGHHPLPPEMARCKELFQFSATHKEEVDFRYKMGEAIEEGVLCDYDLTVPVTTEGHPYICLANLLLSQAGRFRRVLAYCNSVAEAKRFCQVLETVGLAAWHINGQSNRKVRERAMCEFADDLQKPVHVLVTVQVLGEGVNIPNADTCMFVEPRSSYVSIIQAIGRVLRPHPSKPLAHIVLPAIAMTASPATAATTRHRLGDKGSYSSGTKAVARGLAASDEMSQPSGRDDEQHVQEAPLVLTQPGQEISKAPFGAETTRIIHSGSVPQSESCADCGGDSNAPAQWAEGSEGVFKVRSQANSANRPRPCDLKSRRKISQTDELDDYADTGLGRPVRLVPSIPIASVSPIVPIGRGPSAPAQNNRIDKGGGLRAEGRRPCRDHYSLPTPWAEDHSQKGRKFQGKTANNAECSGPSSQSTASITDGQRQSRLQTGMFSEQEPRSHPVAAVPHDAGPSTKPNVGHSAQAPNSSQGAGAGPSTKADLGKLTRRRASKLKVKTADDATGLFGSGHSDQTHRFIEAIAQADSRFANQDVRLLRSRLCVMDCRLQQPIMQHLRARDVQYQLALILQQRDAFDLKVQSVEKFDQEHGRLPRQGSSQLEERTLGHWLHNAGYRQKAQMLSAERMQKLLNSSSSRLRARAAKWLETDATFKPLLEELRQFVRKHNRMPDRSKVHSTAEQQMMKGLQDLVNPSNRNYEKRLQLLEAVGPIVAEWVKPRRARKIKVKMAHWNCRFESLLEFVEVNERLPRQRLQAAQFGWLCRQRRQLSYLPVELQAKLFNSHPAIAAFLRSRSGSCD
eukprot:s585_g17.t2